MSGLRLQVERRLRPMVGMTACGDAIVEAVAPNWHFVAIIDALGHGPEAEESARAAEAAIHASVGAPLETVFDAVHRSLARRRGAVMAGLLSQAATFVFAGVGNVEIFTPAEVNRPVSMAGTLGGGAYRFRTFELPLRKGQRWVLASDGINAREAAPLITQTMQKPARAVADTLLQSASKDTDDVSLVVIDIEGASS
jgi:serine/threonine protein phosphatase PrpC